MHTTAKSSTDLFSGILRCVFYLIFICCFTFFFYFSPKFNNPDWVDSQCEEFNTWDYVDANGNISSVEFPCEIDAKKGETVVFERKLPENIEEKSYLCFLNARDISFYIDDDLRKQFKGSDSDIPFGISKSIFIMVPLSPDDSGKTFTVIKDGKSTYNGRMMEVLYGDAYGLVNHYVRMYGIFYFFVLILLSVSFLTFVIALIQRLFFNKNIRIFSIGLGIFIATAWVAFDSYLYQIVFETYFIDGIMSYFMTMLLPLPFAFYIDSIQKHRMRNALNILCAISIVCILAFTSYCYFSENSFGNILTYIDIYVALAAVALIVIVLFDGIKTKFKDYIYIGIGFLSFIFFGIVEIVSLNLFNASVNGVFTLVGLYVMFILALAQQIDDSEFIKKQLEKKSAQLDKMTLSTIITIANTVDAKDKYTGGHSLCVAEVSRDIALKMGWSKEKAQHIYHIALLHDIGKIAVPDYILNRPGRLTDEEFAIIKKHPATGARILKDIEILDNVQDGALYHHERWDGRGYPKGLKGDDIPLYARIIAVADSYDAMSRNRIYRKHLTPEQIQEEFEKNKGSQFDPKIAEIFLEMLKDGYDKAESVSRPAETGSITSEGMLLNMIVNRFTKNMMNKADSDSLTGIYNRAFAQKAIEDLIMNDHDGVFFMIDMDNFKNVNDKYGHISGDVLLKEFASLLKKNFRQNDIVFRMGGDEFAVFAPGKMDRNLITEKVESLISSVSDISSVRSLDGEDRISISVGIAVSPSDGNEFMELYNNADKALYYAKNNGKNIYHFYGGDDVQRHRTGTEIDMKNIKRIIEESLDLDSGALSVKYGDFKNIYNYVLRYVNRNDTNVQILLFTLSSTKGDYPDIAIINSAMDSLNQAVVESLRRVDVGTRYSNNQYIVILTDSDEKNGKLVGDRVIEHFYKINREMDVLITYAIESINSVPKEDEI